MISPNKSYTMTDYMEILRRRNIVTPFSIVMLGISIYAIFAPREYKASTLVRVTRQRVPDLHVQKPLLQQRLKRVCNL